MELRRFTRILGHGLDQRVGHGKSGLGVCQPFHLRRGQCVRRGLALADDLFENDRVGVVFEAVAEILEADGRQRGAVGPDAAPRPIAVVGRPTARVPVGERAVGDWFARVPDADLVVEEPVRALFRRHGAHQKAAVDGRVLDEHVGVRMVRPATDVPPDVAARRARPGGLVRIEHRRERAPGVHRLDHGVEAVAVVVARGHQECAGELAPQGLGRLFELREPLRLALVETVDVGVIEDAQFDGLLVGGPQSIQGLARRGSIARQTVEVAQVEGDQLSALVQVLDHFEVGRAVSIQAVVVDVVVRQHLRPGELVPLPGIDGILGRTAPLARQRLLFVSRVVMRAERDRDGERAVCRHGERAHPNRQRKGLGRDALRRNGERAAIGARRLVFGGAHTNPEALQVAGGDIDGTEEVQNRVGPPTDVQCAIRRAGLGLDVADHVAPNLRAREHGASGGFQVADADRGLSRCAGYGHHGDLEALLLIACQADLDLPRRLQVERRVAREQLLHRGCQANQERVGGLAGVSAGLLKPGDRFQPLRLL